MPHTGLPCRIIICGIEVNNGCLEGCKYDGPIEAITVNHDDYDDMLKFYFKTPAPCKLTDFCYDVIEERDLEFENILYEYELDEFVTNKPQTFAELLKSVYGVDTFKQLKIEYKKKFEFTHAVKCRKCRFIEYIFPHDNKCECGGEWSVVWNVSTEKIITKVRS